MAKADNKQAEEAANVDTLDTAEVNEPTKHAYLTQPTETTASDYVTAKEDLFFNGVRAHAAGDRVPTANVERNGWSGLVE